MSQPAALLLVVQMNVDPEHERPFNDWYHTHVPHLLEVPGYRWGRRYVGIYGDLKYLALYEIAEHSWLPSLLGPDPAGRPAVVNSEFAQFGRLAGLRDVSINVYEQIFGPPFTPALLERDAVLSLVTADCHPEVETQFNHWYDTSHVPNLLAAPGYLSGRRFRLVEDPVLAHLEMRPKYLALYELADEASVPLISDPDRMSPEARAEFQNWVAIGAPMVRGEIGWNIYRPLAKHWPLN